MDVLEVDFLAHSAESNIHSFSRLVVKWRTACFAPGVTGAVHILVSVPSVTEVRAERLRSVWTCQETRHKALIQRCPNDQKDCKIDCLLSSMESV